MNRDYKHVNQNPPRCHTNYQYPKPFVKDYGPYPFVVNINKAAKQNNYYRTALWTGCHLQVTLMSIRVGGDIGLEIHPDLDQFIRIEQGQGIVMMGDRKDRLDFKEKVCDDFAFVLNFNLPFLTTLVNFHYLSILNIYSSFSLKLLNYRFISLKMHWKYILYFCCIYEAFHS